MAGEVLILVGLSQKTAQTRVPVKVVLWDAQVLPGGDWECGPGMEGCRWLWS